MTATFLFCTLAASAAADEIPGFAERPATDREISYCDHSQELSGQYVFLGDAGPSEMPLEILMCFNSVVWQLDCEMAGAMMDIIGSPRQSDDADLARARENAFQNFGGAESQCRGLFLG